jgi:hypothetical protein
MEKGKKEKEKGFPANWAGGIFGLAECGGQATHQRGTAPWARAHVPARRGGDDIRGCPGGGPAEVRPPVRLRVGSPSRSRFCVDGVVARLGRR